MGKETRDEKTRAFSKKKVSLKIRLLTAVVSPIAFFLLFELVLILLGYGLSNKFFVPWHMGDVAVHVPNKQFCEHFVPQSLSRTPEVSVLFPKTRSQFRIFVLGGSAANGDPDPAYGFCRQLEILLNDHAEGTTFQVVNVAITAMNSHVARGIARDCARHDPDLFILYIGNTHAKRGETQRALSWFERAAQIDPYNYIPQFSVGMQKLTLGEVSDGMKYVTQSVHLKPDFVEGYNTLAKVYKEFDKTEAAQRNATLQALFTP